MKKYWKSIVGVILISSALLYLPVQQLFHDYTSNLLYGFLSELVEEKTEGKYGFEYESLRFNVFKQKIKLSNFSLYLKDSSNTKFDTAALKNQVCYGIKIKGVEISLKNQIDFFFNDKLEIVNVNITEPDAWVINNRIKKNKLSVSKIAGDLYQSITNYLKVFELKNLQVNKAKLDYALRTKKGEKKYSFNEFSFNILDFKLKRKQDSGKFKKRLFTENFELNSGYQEFIMPDSAHKISYDRFGISMKKEFIEIHNLRITPLKNEMKDTKNEIEVFIPTVKLVNIDFATAYRKNLIDIKKLLIERPVVKLEFEVKDNKLDTFSLSQKIAQTNIGEFVNSILVERFILTHSSVILDIIQNGRKQEYLVKGLNYQGFKLKIDSNTFTNFVFGDLHKNYKFNAKEIKHEIAEEGLLAQVKNMNYSSLTKVLDIDKFLIKPNANKIQANLNKHNKKIQLQKLETNGIHLSNFKLDEISDNKRLLLSSSRIIEPKITMLYDTAYVKDTTEINSHRKNILQSILDTFITRNFKIKNALITIKDAGNPRVEFGRFEKVNLYVNRLNINAYNDQSYDVIDLLESSGIKTANSFVKIPGMSQNLSWRALDYSSTNKKIKLHQLSYAEATPKSNLKAKFKLVSVSKFSPKTVINEKEYNLGLVELSGGKIDFAELATSFKKETKFYTNVILDSLSVNQVDFVHSLKDTVKQRIETVSIHASNIKYTKDSLSKSVLALQNLDFTGEKGLFSIDKNRHYLAFNEVMFSAKDSSLNAHNINITPVIHQRNNNSKTLVRSNIEYFTLSKVAINPNNIQSQLVGGELNICSPTFRMSTKLSNNKIPKPGKSFIELHKWFANSTGINLIKYDALNVENGLVDIVFENRDKTPKVWHFSVPQYNISANDFRLDSSQSNTDKNLFYANSIMLNAYNIEQIFPDTLRNATVQHLFYNTKKQYLKLEETNLRYMIYRKKDTSKQMFITGKIPLLELDGLKPLKLKRNKVLNLKRIHLKNPDIEITQFHKNTDYVSRELEIDKSNKDKTAIKNLVLNELELVDGNITWNFEGVEKDSIKFNHVALKSTEIKMDPNTKNELPKFGVVELSFGDFKHDVMQKYYDLQLDSFYLNSSTEEMTISGAELVPRYGIFEFAKVAGWEKSRLELYISKLNFEQFKTKELIYNNTFSASLINADSLWIRNFKNKNYPMISRNMGIPTLNLNNSKLKIDIDSIHLSDGHIEHRQLAKNGVKSGKLLFTKLNASMNNITNDSAAISINKYMNLKAYTLLMDKGLIAANFDFDLTDSAQRFVGDARIGAFDATLLNSYLEPTAYVRIRKGHVNGGNLEFFADDKLGAGEMKLLYKNLHVDFLNQKDPSKNKKMGLLMKTFLANRVVNTKNPHFLITKKGDIFYRRDTARSIFQYWGNLAMSGVASSAGVTSNKKDVKKLNKEIKRLKKELLRKEKAIRRKEDEEEEEAAKKKKKQS